MIMTQPTANCVEIEMHAREILAAIEYGECYSSRKALNALMRNVEKLNPMLQAKWDEYDKGEPDAPTSGRK